MIFPNVQLGFYRTDNAASLRLMKNLDGGRYAFLTLKYYTLKLIIWNFLFKRCDNFIWAICGFIRLLCLPAGQKIYNWSRTNNIE